MSGWGSTRYKGAAANVLQYALIGFAANRSACVEAYSNRTGIRQITGNMLCAGGRQKDSCEGDSGGPLSCFKWNRREKLDEVYLCGIVSFGVGCKAAVPGMYTDVSKYYGWIQKHIATAERTLWSKEITIAMIISISMLQK